MILNNTNKKKLISDYQGNGAMIPIPISKKYTNNELIYVCKFSGLIRAKKNRSYKEIADDWSKYVFDNTFSGTTYTAKVPAVYARQIYVAETLKNNLDIKNKTICDIGAGEGQFLNILKTQYKAKVFGIEPSLKNCKKMSKQKIKNFCGTIEDFKKTKKFRKNYFDVITITWTLVNSYSCYDIVNIAYEMLKPNGIIVIAESSRILTPFKKPLNLYLSKLPVDLHTFHFSFNSLSNLLLINKFKINYVNRYIDSDVLLLIGSKKNITNNNKFSIDNYKEVMSFFKRWHKETEYYY